MSEEKEIGTVMSYYTNISVAAIRLTGALKINDQVRIKGNTTDFTQKIASLQINRKEVKSAKKGDEIGIKVIDRVRPNDRIYIVK